MSVRVMGTARKLREIANFASLIQSHALSFFYLSSQITPLNKKKKHTIHAVIDRLIVKSEIRKTKYETNSNYKKYQ